MAFEKGDRILLGLGMAGGQRVVARQVQIDQRIVARRAIDLPLGR